MNNNTIFNKKIFIFFCEKHDETFNRQWQQSATDHEEKINEK